MSSSLNHMRHIQQTTSLSSSSASSTSDANSAAAAAAAASSAKRAALHIDYRKRLQSLVSGGAGATKTNGGDGGIESTSSSSSGAMTVAEAAHQLAPRFLVECSIKLHMKPLTSATASILYHRFFGEGNASPHDYDAFLLASACLYLAGKIKDDPVKIRDVINVSHNTLNRGAAPLELNDDYWAMRDGIVQAELLITRMLKFDLNVVHPHKYLLHFMATLQDWFGKQQWQSLPLARTAAGFLQDFHSHPAILDYKPAHVAVGCLSLAFQTYGVQVPVTNEFDENLVWYNVFAKDLTKDMHWELLEKIMEVYQIEQQDEK